MIAIVFLKDLLDSLLLESSENKRHFIRACINGLQIHGKERKGRACLVWVFFSFHFPKFYSLYLFLSLKSDVTIFSPRGYQFDYIGLDLTKRLYIKVIVTF